MGKKKKLCPFLSVKEGKDTYCPEDKCLLWDGENDCCLHVTIARKMKERMSAE